MCFKDKQRIKQMKIDLNDRIKTIDYIRKNMYKITDDLDKCLKEKELLKTEKEHYKNGYEMILSRFSILCQLLKNWDRIG